MLMARTKTQAAALHRSASLAGTHTVMTGVAAAAPSPEVMTRVAGNAARVNPAAAGVIRQAAVAAFRPTVRPRSRTAGRGQFGAQRSAAEARERRVWCGDENAH